MKKILMLIGIILLLIVPCSSPIISAGSKTLYPTDDTYVNINAPNTNYGEIDYMLIRTDYWGGQIDGLVKFDVSSIPIGSTIVSAKLNLYYYGWAGSNPNDREIKLYTMIHDWDEDNITWNTCGRDNPYYIYTTVPSSFSWMTWDVTSNVQDFVDGTKANYGWKVGDHQGWLWGDVPQTKFRTKEYGNYIPYLEIDYAQLTVNSPPLGDIWRKGETNNITWDSEDAGNYVKIESYKSGSYYYTIASSTSNDGSYSWTIPSSLSTSSSYKIKITSTSYSTVYDESEYFSIQEPIRYITVTSPSSGTTWYKGETETITWSSLNAGSNVKIQYKIGSYYYTIASSTSNDGSYSWTIPSSLSTSSSYKIKISSTSYSNVEDESDYFSIDERYITVNSPYSGSKWYEGGTYSITWSPKNAGSSVKIELYKSSLRVSTITSSTSNDGSYSWTIPSSLTSSSYYKIRITSTSFSNVYDDSSSFSIDIRYITVNSPSGGGTCYKGETKTINWNSDNAGSNVKIELYKNGKYHSTITSSTSNDGSYSWTIPTSISSSSSYKIKITSASNSNVYDYSNSYLTIKETWLQKWQWAIAITVLITIILIAIGIRTRAKNKGEKRVFEKEKKEIKDIIQKATSKKKIEHQKIKEKKKRKIVTDYNWHSIKISECPRWLKEAVKKYKSKHHPKHESAIFNGRHFRYEVNFGDLKGKYVVKRRLRHKHWVDTPRKKT